MLIWKRNGLTVSVWGAACCQATGITCVFYSALGPQHEVSVICVLEAGSPWGPLGSGVESCSVDLHESSGHWRSCSWKELRQFSWDPGQVSPEDCSTLASMVPPPSHCSFLEACSEPLPLLPILCCSLELLTTARWILASCSRACRTWANTPLFCMCSSSSGILW